MKLDLLGFKIKSEWQGSLPGRVKFHPYGGDAKSKKNTFFEAVE